MVSWREDQQERKTFQCIELKQKSELALLFLACLVYIFLYQLQSDIGNFQYFRSLKTSIMFYAPLQTKGAVTFINFAKTQPAHSLATVPSEWLQWT